MMRLCVLGTPKLETPTGKLLLPLERISWLLTILAARGDWVRREELTTLLWEENTEGLQQRLRQLLYRTKQLGFGAAIQTEVTRLRWLGSSDLSEFKAALQAGHELEALQLCKGELLLGVTPNDTEFGAWLTLERDFIAAKRQEITLRLAPTLDPSQALDLLELLPLSEEVLLEVLRLARISGLKSRGQAMFSRFERELLELDEIPSSQIMAAYGQLQDSAVAALPAALKSATLPPALTPLFGRERELRWLQSALQQHPILTILGIGGIGKTSLALEAARTLSIEAVFVSLEAVESNASFAPSIMSALGYSFISNQSPDIELFVALAGRQDPLLLILDNVEQCIETARAFATKFAAIANLTLLFTTRTRLGIRAEHLMELHGLDLPISGADLEQTGAGKAFLAAARRQRRWIPNPTEREIIARLCQTLTGSPLALELAAAWLRALSIGDIEQEIRQSLDFLEGSLTDLPPRQAGLRATFNYSWRLLSSSEQRSLRRLSIFRNGFNQEAAIAVTGISHRDILGLSEKSLLRLTGQRLSLHPLIREYASEELRQIETDWNQVAVAHAAYYHDFIATHQDKLRTFEQLTFLPILELELDNFRAALTWALAGNDQTLAMSLSESLGNFWITKGLLSEGAHWLEASLSNHQVAPNELLARTWTALAQIQQMLGDLHTSVSSIKQAMNVATQIGSHNLLVLARNIWARSLNRLGQFEEMYQVCQETMLIPQGILPRAISLSWLGHAEFMARNDLKNATIHFEESLQTLRIHGSVNGVALVVSGLGMVAAARQDYQAARACLQEAIALTKKIGNRFGQGLHNLNLGRIEMMAGNLETAHDLITQSLHLSQEIAARRDISYALIQLGHVHQRLNQYQEAEQHYLQAIKLARDLSDTRLQLEALIGMANHHQNAQQPEKAAEYLGLALHHPQSNYEIAAHGQATLAALQLELSNPEKFMQQGLERGLETTVALLLRLESRVLLEV